MVIIKAAPYQAPKLPAIPSAEPQKAAHPVADYLKEHEPVKAAVQDGMAVSQVMHAFPKFVYPSIYGATPAEKAMILQTLDGLPLKDVNSVKSLTVVPSIPKASGEAYRYTVTNTIQLSRQQINLSPAWGRYVTTHEVGHTKDFASAWFQQVGLGNHSSSGPWGKPPHVTDYAGTNRFEDYAESYAKYHTAPEELKKAAPEKYKLIQQQEQQGPLQSLIDRKEFRETGKWIGEHIAPTEAVRTGMEVAYWATGALQLAVGLEQLGAAHHTHDPQTHMNGVLNSAAGLLFATQTLSMAGLAVQGAHRALEHGIKHGDISAVDADTAVRKVSDPLGWLGSAVGLPGSPAPAAKKADKPHTARAAAIGLGGAAGGLVGGIAGPYLGVLAGYHLAGAIGGAVGLVAGGVLGYSSGAKLGGQAGGAIAKAFGG